VSNEITSKGRDQRETKLKETMKTFTRKLRRKCVLLFIAAYSLLAFSAAAAQDPKPILVVFHGADETRDDVRELAQASHDTKMFSRVVVIGYNWRNGKISEAAPRIFNSLNNRFPRAGFVLLGNKEGGLIAEWIATKVRSAEGRIVRVITLNSPLEGSDLHAGSVAAGLKDLAPDSDTIRALKDSPTNDVHSVEFLRLWEKENKNVTQQSALRALSGTATSRLVVRTKRYNPRAAIPGLIAEAKKTFFDDKQYDKVIVLCENILKIDADQQQALLLLAPSYYHLAMAETNAVKATSMYAESGRYFARIMDAGYSAIFPVAHHHAEFMDQNVCAGVITLSKNTFKFESTNAREKNLEVPIGRIAEVKFEPQKAGRLHISVRVLRGTKERIERYNFHAAGIGLERETVWLSPTAPISFNSVKCPTGCESAMEVIHVLLKRLL